jgi:hypothetical protein
LRQAGMDRGGEVFHATFCVPFPANPAIAWATSSMERGCFIVLSYYGITILSSRSE